MRRLHVPRKGRLPKRRGTREEVFLLAITAGQLVCA